jgi:catechol 2,3-dioxygenase-like lactoylglutathione lyase family enzyme
MRILLTTVFVDDQAQAERFYVDVLGLRKKHDVPLGEDRWLTVVSSEDPEGAELLLEPARHPAADPFRRALFGDGIPALQLTVDDLASEHGRLQALGVRFTQDPVSMGDVATAVLDDTCGNLVQLVEGVR